MDTRSHVADTVFVHLKQKHSASRESTSLHARFPQRGPLFLVLFERFLGVLDFVLKVSARHLVAPEPRKQRFSGDAHVSFFILDVRA